MNELARQKIKRSVRDVPVEFRRLFYKQYPPFVTSRAPSPLRGEIPVFMFHRVTRRDLEEKLAFLKMNGYHTLSLNEFMGFLMGQGDTQKNAVLLTFDDGEKSLYQVAYPLLKDYGFQATAFVIPYFIPEEPDRTGEKGMASWNQLEEIDKSGVVDVQSHSYYHDLIFTRPELVDFYHPHFDPNPLGIDIPWVDENGKYTNNLPWGTPIYRFASRFGGGLRFLDDPRVRNTCAKFTAENGGKAFFQQPGWKKELGRIHQQVSKGRDNSCYETAQSRMQSLLYNLEESKQVLEEKLDKPVRHLCLPRGEGSPLTAALSKEVGYSSIFWVTKQGRRTNKGGDSPFSIVRVKDDYIFRLPGKDRKPLSEIFQTKLSRRVETLDLY
jgi:hypothetical protein